MIPSDYLDASATKGDGLGELFRIGIPLVIGLTSLVVVLLSGFLTGNAATQTGEWKASGSPALSMEAGNSQVPAEDLGTMRNQIRSLVEENHLLVAVLGLMSAALVGVGLGNYRASRT